MKAIADIHYDTLVLFDYKPDSETFKEVDHWKSFADDVKAGKRFTGDCDDFCLTIASLLADEGYDKSLIRISLVDTERGGAHLVCTYTDTLLDNRFRIPKHWADVNYTWWKYMQMDNPGTWLEIEG